MGGKVYGTRGKGRKMSKKKGRGGEGKFRGAGPPNVFSYNRAWFTSA